jgi:hypothetical protein
MNVLLGGLMISNESPLKVSPVIDTLTPPIVLVLLGATGTSYTLDIQNIEHYLVNEWAKSSEMLSKESWKEFAKKNRIPAVEPQEYCQNNDYWAAVIPRNHNRTIEIYMGHCLNGAIPKLSDIAVDVQGAVPKLVKSARGKWFEMFRWEIYKFWVGMRQKTEIWINGEKSKIILKTSPPIRESFRDPQVMGAVYTWSIVAIGGMIPLLSQQSALNPWDYIRNALGVLLLAYIIAAIIRWWTTRAKSSWELVND